MLPAAASKSNSSGGGVARSCAEWHSARRCAAQVVVFDSKCRIAWLRGTEGLSAGCGREQARGRVVWRSWSACRPYTDHGSLRRHCERPSVCRTVKVCDGAPCFEWSFSKKGIEMRIRARAFALSPEVQLYRVLSRCLGPPSGCPCVRARTCVCMHGRVCVCVYLCVHVCVSMCVCVCILCVYCVLCGVCIMYIYMCMCICLYIHIYICVCVLNTTTPQH